MDCLPQHSQDANVSKVGIGGASPNKFFFPKYANGLEPPYEDRQDRPKSDGSRTLSAGEPYNQADAGREEG
jgi:hypothetical protein